MVEDLLQMLKVANVGCGQIKLFGMLGLKAHPQSDAFQNLPTMWLGISNG